MLILGLELYQYLVLHQEIEMPLLFLCFSEYFREQVKHFLFVLLVTVMS